MLLFITSVTIYIVISLFKLKLTERFIFLSQLNYTEGCMLSNQRSDQF